MTTVLVDASVWVAAADASDRFSTVSRAFLEAVARRGVPVTIPAIARVEVACALARRLRDPGRARRLTEGLLHSPLVDERELAGALLARSSELGTTTFLRAGDALYAATAVREAGGIVSWDDELITRAHAVTPEAWLAADEPD